MIYAVKLIKCFSLQIQTNDTSFIFLPGDDKKTASRDT